MPEIDEVFIKLDQLISMSRLRELGLIMSTDRVERITRMIASLSELREGAYLLGTGPSTVSIIPLTVEEIVLGRRATPGETSGEAVVDYEVADTLYFGPWEVSRSHAKIVRQGPDSDRRFTAIDLGSTCGTFVNGERLASDGDGQVLSHGDVISLGPSQVSTYMFFVASPDEADE